MSSRFLALAVVAIALAACRGSDDGATVAAQSTSAAKAAQSETAAAAGRNPRAVAAAVLADIGAEAEAARDSWMKIKLLSV